MRIAYPTRSTMHTITIYADDGPVEYQYPGAWDEVTAEQLPKLAHVLSITDEPATIRFFLLQKLAGIPPEHMALVDAPSVTVQQTREVPDGPFGVTEQTAWHLLPSLDWCFAQPVNRNSLLPAFTHHDKTWHGPTDQMANVTLSQFAWADELLNAVHGNPDEALINKFLGALYTPEGSTFSNDAIPANADALADLPAITKLSAILNYRALRGYLSTTFKRVFAGGEDGEKPLESGLFGVIYDVTASAVFGDIDKAEARPVMQVLHYMEHQIEKDQREAERLKAATP